jgi:hypothetical protein
MGKGSVNTPENGTFLPEFLFPAHNLCFANHDILVELLAGGEAIRSFDQRVPWKDDEEKNAFLRDLPNVFDWLASTGRTAERIAFLRATVFRSLLSDCLHFIYEALDSSRRAKLSVCYALLRKPLQDHLALFESMVLDPASFATTLEENPGKLSGPKLGGPPVHSVRIARVLEATGDTDRFDPDYLAQLRYAKDSEDGFSGICDHAIHLFTDNKAIRTEKMNINFIFSDEGSRQKQWYFLYSRLPYVLVYARRLIEHLYATFETRTDPVYLKDIERRISAAVLLWWPGVEGIYKNAPLERFVEATRVALDSECKASGFRTPSTGDLIRMHESGAYPGESRARVFLRGWRYRRGVALRSRLVRSKTKK